MDLSGLSAITSVSGDLRVFLTQVEHLDGLGGIQSVDKGVWISGNDSLVNLDALSNLTHLEGDIHTAYC